MRETGFRSFFLKIANGVRYKKIFVFVISILMLIFSLSIFSYTTYLKFTNTEETNLYETVSLNPTIEPEFDSQGIFWWLLDGKNLLYLNNYSNEERIVELNLILENNPCGSLSFVIINNMEFKFENKKIEIKKNFNLSPYEKREININNKLKNTCMVKNDNRLFGSKLREWYVK